MKIKLLSVAFSALVLAGCSTVQNGSISRDKIKITVDSDRSVLITNISAFEKNNELKVTGTLRPKSKMVRTAGHIHVRFIDDMGAVIRHLKVEPHINAFFRRSISRPRFSTSATLAATEVSEVRLKHHDAPLGVCSYGISSMSPMSEYGTKEIGK